jgi:hypothetical protein
MENKVGWGVFRFVAGFFATGALLETFLSMTLSREVLLAAGGGLVVVSIFPLAFKLLKKLWS